MTNLIKLFDGSAIGIGPAIDNLKRGLKEHNVFCMVESSFEIGGAFTTLGSYFGKGLANIGMLWSFFSDHIPTILTVLGKTLNTVAGRTTFGVIGIATSGSRLIKEGIALARQRMFLAIFKKSAWQGENIRDALAEAIRPTQPLPTKFRNLIAGKQPMLQQLLDRVDIGDQDALKAAEKILTHWTGRNIRETLRKVCKLQLVELERSLPIWLYQDLLTMGGKVYLDALLKRVSAGDKHATAEATKLLNQMSSYATKKQLVHILKIIGAIVGIISCIGFFVAFPFALTVAFMVVITIISTASYLVNAGYVENREDRFSLAICIPEFLRTMPATIKQTAVDAIQKVEEKMSRKKIRPAYEIFQQQRLAKESSPQLHREMQKVRRHQPQILSCAAA